MDDRHFDDLTRALATMTGRRQVLRRLAAGIAVLMGLSKQSVTAQGSGNKPAGASCVRATECASRHCVDGVCCTSACSGQCEACSLPGSEGSCTPVSGAPAGARQACPGAGVCRARCDGVSRKSCTAWPGSEITCGSSTCSNGWQTTYACGGNGTCRPTTTSCGLYPCDAAGAACLTTCEDNADCVGAAYCANGICQGEQPLGQACASADQCQSGFCVDGVCCNSACGGPCASCNVAGHVGRCTEVADGSVCAGGICCGAACCGPSTTCVQGTCQPCTPIGFGAGNACTAATPCCDGGSCVTFPGFAGSPSFCRPAGCRLGGEPCDDVSACCSQTCGGHACQQ
ncbi:MAG: hypothetical protein ACRDJW_26200 [Thermomicrobiales bacterium]